MSKGPSHHGVQRTSSSDLMTCPWCNYENVASAEFCGDCGRSLQTEVVCAACDRANPGANRFCDACGAQLGGQAQPAVALPRVEESPKRQQGPPLRWETPLPQWDMSWEYLRSWIARNRWELLLVALLTGVAAFLRLYRLADLPPGLHGDEAWTGLDALRILDEGWIGPYVGSALGQPTGPLYFTALIFKLFDVSLFTLRLSIALFGIVTVPLAYFMFRLGFGRWVAVFGTVALTFSFWHIHFSRTAFMVISMPMIITLAAIAAFWAMRSTRKLPWFVTGLVLGVGVYTYNGYPGFLVAASVLFAVHFALLRSRWRYYLLRYVLLALGFVLAALPMIHLVAHSPGFYLSHARHVSVARDPGFLAAESFEEKVDFLARRAWHAATLLIRHTDIDYTDSTGGRGALNPLLALLAYLGLVVSLAKWRSPPHLLSVIAVLAAMGIIVIGGANWGEMRRSMVALPFVYGLAGLASVEIVRTGRRLFGKVGHRVALLAVAVGLTSVIAWNSVYYFGDFVQQEHVRWVYVDDLVDSLRSAHGFDEPGNIYFYSPRWSYDYETRRFLYPDTLGMDRSKEFGSFSLERLDPGPVTYVFLPPYDRELDSVMGLHPDGTALSEKDAKGGTRFAVYHLP